MSAVMPECVAILQDSTAVFDGNVRQNIIKKSYRICCGCVTAATAIYKKL